MSDFDGHYYCYFIGQGHDLLREQLRADDPFALSPSEIVQRLLAAGFGPNVGLGQRHLFAMTGRIRTVDFDDQRFIVWVDPESETIGLQEIRAEAYELSE